MSTKTKDPVCGGILDAGYTRHKADIGGFEFYFCSEACRERFEDSPDQYIRKARA